MKETKDMNQAELNEYLIELNIKNNRSELVNLERISQFQELKKQCEELMAALQNKGNPL